MGRDHVGITLDDGHPARLADGIPRQIRAIEHRPLVKKRRLGAVQIFGDMLALRGHRPLDLGQNPPAKSERPAALVVNREDQPAPEPLAPDPGRVSGLADQAGLLQQLHAESLALCLGQQPAALRRCIPSRNRSALSRVRPRLSR